MLHCPGSDDLFVRGEGARYERRFLGGPFAVTVRFVPRDANVLGTGAGMEVFRVPGDPRFLYVRRGGIVERWLPLPRRPIHSPSPVASAPSATPSAPSFSPSLLEPGSAPSVAFIGDSVLQGATPWLLASLPGWVSTVDAEIGRASFSGIAIAARVAIGVPKPDVVAVELGTNDADPVAFRANAEAILTSLKDVPLVIWQTTHGPMDHVPLVNDEIRRVARRFPNTAIADWDAFVPAVDLTSDGVHPRTEHEDDMAKLILPLLGAWVAAASRPALESCPGTSAASAP
ncbi:MAG: hypothetical protein M3O98_04425 [Actinomycetota bacterium]|nr:hypothetical protein [Actinomycetota bacterium]